LSPFDPRELSWPLLWYAMSPFDPREPSWPLLWYAMSPFDPRERSWPLLWYAMFILRSQRAVLATPMVCYVKDSSLGSKIYIGYHRSMVCYCMSPFDPKELSWPHLWYALSPFDPRELSWPLLWYAMFILRSQRASVASRRATNLTSQIP